MAYLIVLVGLILGLIVFTFTFIISRRNGRYYLAPLITFLFFGIIVAYSLIIVGGFEGMGYFLVAIGVLLSSIIGTLLLPLLIKKNMNKKYKKHDNIILLILPVLFLVLVGILIFPRGGHWIIAESSIAPVEEEGYRISTISEGRKSVTLYFGNDYLGKEVEVEKVSNWGSTEIILNFIDGNENDKVPFIQIGIKEIKEPLKVESSDGASFENIKEAKIN